MMKKLAFALYAFSLVAVSWLSYSFVDPNLTLISTDWFATWQNARWQLATDPSTLATIYLCVTSLAIFSYGWVLWTAKSIKKLTISCAITSVIIVSIIAVLGHNAYSHDIFNYIFNAKMVLVYGADPHIKTALDFSYDPWLRFMHNVHTSAPYGYGWTGLSLIPFVLGDGKFLPIYLNTKLFMAGGLAFLLWSVWQLLQLKKRPDNVWRWSLLALHPLLITETLMNGHNDVWMMGPVLAGWYLLKAKRHWASILMALALFSLSVSIKYASVLLLPLILMDVLVIRHTWTDWIRSHWAELSALLLLVPLLTDRSQQFHPWYLIWSLSFLPLINWRWLHFSLLGLSATSLLRYYSWIVAGFHYNDQVQLEQRLITWSGLILGLAVWVLSKKVNYHHHHQAKN